MEWKTDKRVEHQNIGQIKDDGQWSKKQSIIDLQYEGELCQKCRKRRSSVACRQERRG